MSRFFDSWWGAQRDRCRHDIPATEPCNQCVEEATAIMAKVRASLDEELEGRKLDKILHELTTLLKRFDEFEAKFRPRLTRGYITYSGGSTMPLALQIGQSSIATFNGLDQFGQAFPIDFTAGQYKILWAVADSAAVGLTPNADGTVKVSGVAASAGDAITVSVTRPDGVVISASDSVSVAAAPPPAPVLTSGSISFSAPA